MRPGFAVACLMVWLGSSGLGSTVFAQTPNACGCYADAKGNCTCTKKSKCGCPGECEPVGCEAKREKQADKDAQTELKRITAQEKKKAAAAAKTQKKKPKTAEKPSDKPIDPP